MKFIAWVLKRAILFLADLCALVFLPLYALASILLLSAPPLYQTARHPITNRPKIRSIPLVVFEHWKKVIGSAWRDCLAWRNAFELW